MRLLKFIFGVFNCQSKVEVKPRKNESKLIIERRKFSNILRSGHLLRPREYYSRNGMYFCRLVRMGAVEQFVVDHREYYQLKNKTVGAPYMKLLGVKYDQGPAWLQVISKTQDMPNSCPGTWTPAVFSAVWETEFLTTWFIPWIAELALFKNNLPLFNEIVTKLKNSKNGQFSGTDLLGELYISAREQWGSQVVGIE